MNNIIQNYRIYFYLLAAFLVFAIALPLFTPLLTDYYSNNWREILEERLNEIESESIQSFKNYEKNLISVSSDLKSTIEKLPVEQAGKELIGLFNSSEYENYSIQLFDSEFNIVAWSYFSTKNQFFPEIKEFFVEESFFLSSSLSDELVIIDTVSNYYLVTRLQFEKNYQLNSEYFQPVSFTNELKEKFGTEIEIYYDRNFIDIKDGRKYTFPVHNNYNNSIAQIIVDKPSLDSKLMEVNEVIASFSSVFFMISLLFLGMIFYKYSKDSKSLLKNNLILILYLVCLRTGLAATDIPSRFLSNQFSDAAFFSSQIVFGIVRSPLELFITILFTSIIAVLLYRIFIIQLNNSGDRRKLGGLTSLFGLLSLVFIFFLQFRGFGASIDSMIVDSTIRYFKDYLLLPEPVVLLMHLNLLLLGFGSILISITLISICVLFLRFKFLSDPVMKFFALFLLFQVIGIIFDIVQNQPQSTSLMRIFYITICFGFVYAIIFRSIGSTNIYILVMFTSSFITINMLNYFNAELEKKSLRNTAYQLTRTDVNLLDYLMTETLTKISEDKQLKYKFDDGIINFNSEAYKIWSRSRLEKEMVGSSINLVDTNFNLLGSFSFNVFDEFAWKWSGEDGYKEGLVIMQENLESYGPKKLRGIVPIKDGTRLLGYVEIIILIDLYRLGFENTPQFISTSNFFGNSPVNMENLKIFDFHDGELVNYYTDLILSQVETDEILNAEFNENGEAWLSCDLNDQDHIIYVKKRSYNDFTRILAIALEEKNTSWNLFDFFKIFFIHSVFIIIFLFLLYLFYFRKIIEVKYSFRAQLLFSFLLISIIPLIFLAGYFKSLTDEKNTSAVYYTLGKRADRVEGYVNDYHNDSEMSLFEIYDRASRDLEIDFSIYYNFNLEYSTSGVYYNIGLLPQILNSNVYQQILLSGRKEFVIREQLDKFEFHSFYHKAKIGDREYLIKVSDLFNRIRLPMTGTEVDIFLIGTYSIAVLLVILISTILANQISRPIRNLTSATRSVARGDLNIVVKDKNRGEIQELVNGFNSMVKELKIKQIELAEMERETAWKDMAKQVAHEIKNPLTPMKLSIQQLVAAHNDNSSKFNSIFEKVTNTIIHQIDTLKNIASEFSAFARMPRLKIENVDIIKVLFDAKILFTDEKVDIQIESDHRRYIVSNDFDQLLRILINLIRNSIQAKATRVEMKLTEINDHYEIAISDNGTGIDEKYINRVFDLNFTTKIEGMGIGLNVAKRFVESVHGKIKISKSSKNGTTIVILLPKKIDEQTNSLSERST